MKQFLAALLAIAVVGVSISAFVFMGGISGSSTSQSESIGTASNTTAMTTAYTYSRNSAGGLIEQVNTTSGRLDGCNILAATNSSQGYDLTVYISSFSPTMSSSACMTAVIQDDTGVPLTMAQGSDLELSVVVTNSIGQKVTSDGCVPIIPPPPLNGTSPPAPQALQCGGLWDTQAPVNGVSLQPGTYQVSVGGSAQGSGNQTITVSSKFDVTLASG